MALTDNLVSYWKLDEASGNAADSVGTNTLTNNGTTAYAAGKINNGVDFENGTSQYLSISDGSQSGLDFTGDFSAAFWVNFETDPDTADAVPLAKYAASGNRAYACQYIGGGWRLVISNNGSAESVTSTLAHSVSTSTWYHIAFAFDASAGSAEFWANASSLGTGTGAHTSIFNGSGAFALGSLSGLGNYLDGKMDEVGVWNRLLTSAEVTELYNGGTGLAYPFVAAATAFRRRALLGVGQ